MQGEVEQFIVWRTQLDLPQVSRRYPVTRAPSNPPTGMLKGGGQSIPKMELAIGFIMKEIF